jgi:exodeoxyribonuclease-5
MDWSPQQEEALRKAKRWRKSGKKPYFTLAGYAGTGKTTLARELSKDAGGPVFYAAYTGKAAHVLRKTGLEEASTIHKLIYLPRNKCDERLGELEARLGRLLRAVSPNTEKIAKVRGEIILEQENLRRPDFTLNIDSPLGEAKLLVIDEYSMVDQRAGVDLLSFGCPILALGDPGQLPPVKGTQYFTGEPDVVLTEIHRQAEGSPIIRMSKYVREGRELGVGRYDTSRVLHGGDVTPAQLGEMMLGADQVLVGTNLTRRRLNQEIRTLLGREGVLPVAGDKLVCLRNNHKEGLLNGQTWTVERVRGKKHLELGLCNEDGERLTCLAHRDHFEGDGAAIDPRARRDANEFDFGYALTVHKSQGSQWDNVLLFDEWHGANRRQWLYTAITRAAERITIVC